MGKIVRQPLSRHQAPAHDPDILSLGIRHLRKHALKTLWKHSAEELYSMRNTFELCPEFLNSSDLLSFLKGLFYSASMLFY